MCLSGTPTYDNEYSALTYAIIYIIIDLSTWDAYGNSSVIIFFRHAPTDMETKKCCERAINETIFNPKRKKESGMGLVI